VVSNVARQMSEPLHSWITAEFWVAVWLDTRSLSIVSSRCKVGNKTLVIRRLTFLGVNLNQGEGIVNWQFTFTFSQVALDGVWA